MTRVLLVTVGGSPEPILNAVESHQPDELIFICSGPPCRAPSLEQVIGVGPMSGRSNVTYFLEKRGVEPTDERVARVLERAKGSKRLLTEDEVLAAARG